MNILDGVLLSGIELARSILIAYSVYAITVALGSRIAGLPTRWEEWVKALGGLIYLVGIVAWRRYPGGDTYDIDLFLRAVGSALLMFPRLVRIVLREFS